MPLIGLLHPGEMGSAVGGCLTAAGHAVQWASRGRSAQTAARADAAGLADAVVAAELARRADILISVCPPHAALEVARSVKGFRGLYLDANAIAPRSASEVAAIVEGDGASYVDGGIIGPPPEAAGTTRLYLCGPEAEKVRDLFVGTPLDARVLAGPAMAASAVKMAYAAWTKGSAALVLTALALADAECVGDALRGEWDLSQPGLRARCDAAARSAAAKGWRWTAEMEEIAATMTAAGLPSGFHEAAAEIFRGYPRRA